MTMLKGHARHLCLFALVLALFVAGHGGPAQAQDAIYEINGDPIAYTRCYAVASVLPGPASAYGEDICVAYQVISWEYVRVGPGEVSGSDVSWMLSENGEAVVTAASDGAELDRALFKMREGADDIGDDAECMWGGDGLEPPTRASVAACANLAALDAFTYALELFGQSQTYTVSATGSAPDGWCAFDNTGAAYGPGCDG